MKTAHEIRPSDLMRHRVWEFVDDMETELPDETYVRPVKHLPVDTLSGRLASATAIFANGRKVLTLLANVDLADPVKTEHFLMVTIFKSSAERFDLARYHDVDYPRRGPTALATFLGLPLEDVFPIRYDISDLASGHPDCLSWSVPATPTSRLSHDALIQLALR